MHYVQANLKPWSCHIDFATRCSIWQGQLGTVNKDGVHAVAGA